MRYYSGVIGEKKKTESMYFWVESSPNLIYQLINIIDSKTLKNQF